MRRFRRFVGPQQGATLNRGHPLARGLVNFYILGEHLPVCLVTGRRGTPSSTRPVLQATPIGRGLRGGEAITAYVDVPVQAFAALEAVTYAVGIYPAGAQTLEQRVFDNGVSDNSPPKLTAGVSANTWQFYSNSAGTPGIISTSVTWTDFSPQLHCFT